MMVVELRQMSERKFHIRKLVPDGSVESWEGSDSDYGDKTPTLLQEHLQCVHSGLKHC